MSPGNCRQPLRRKQRLLPLLSAVIAAATLWLAPARARASEETPLPPAVQTKILAQVLAYQRNLKATHVGVVRTLVLTRAGSAESLRVANQFTRALADLKAMVGMRHEEITMNYTDGLDLAAVCRNREISVVYITPGLDEKVSAIAAALRSSGVLSVSPVPRLVGLGIVVGFDVVGGKPQLLVNRRQMGIQDVRLSEALLKVMQVYE